MMRNSHWSLNNHWEEEIFCIKSTRTDDEHWWLTGDQLAGENTQATKLHEDSKDLSSWIDEALICRESHKLNVSNREGQQVIVCSFGVLVTFSPAVLSLYLCLSCRCRAGCSCRARRSTCHPHGQWSPHSPPHLRRSYPAGSPSSSHIPAQQQTTGFSWHLLSFVSTVRLGLSNLLSEDEHRYFQMNTTRKIALGDTVLI